jgi:hypothetical protein
MAKQKPKPPEDNNDPYANLSKEERAEIKRALGERKDKALADRLEVQNAVTRRELIPRVIFSSLMGRHYAVDRSQFLEIPASSAMTIAAIFRRSDTSIAVESIMSDMCYNVMGKVKNDIGSWLNKIPVQSE